VPCVELRGEKYIKVALCLAWQNPNTVALTEHYHRSIPSTFSLELPSLFEPKVTMRFSIIALPIMAGFAAAQTVVNPYVLLSCTTP
jgi:hypothetical protein